MTIANSSQDMHANESRKGDIVEITPARTDSDLETVANLFRNYAHALGFDLTFQSFEEELAQIPGKYAPPRGQLLLARRLKHCAMKIPKTFDHGDVLGCVGCRPLAASNNRSISDRTCEMKRLYVTPAGRGLGVGKLLVKAAIDFARRSGYKWMLLDTLPTMTAAQALYRAHGFTECERYYETPLEGTMFMSLNLQNEG